MQKFRCSRAACLCFCIGWMQLRKHVMTLVKAPESKEHAACCRLPGVLRLRSKAQSVAGTECPLKIVEAYFYYSLILSLRHFTPRLNRESASDVSLLGQTQRSDCNVQHTSFEQVLEETDYLLMI